MLSTNKDISTFYFSIWMPLISCFCLIALTIPSGTMLDKSSGRRYPCLVPKLWRKMVSLFLLSMMLAVGVS